MMTCCSFILSAVVTVQSSVIRKAPSVPILFQPSSGDDESSSSPSTISSECEEAAAIRETLKQASLNFRDCEDETASQECVGAIQKDIAECYKNIKIASECVQETFESLRDEANPQCFCGGLKRLQSMAVTVEAVMCSKKSRQGNMVTVNFPEDIEKLAGDVDIDINVDDVAIVIPDIPQDVALLLLEQLLPLSLSLQSLSLSTTVPAQ